MLFTAEELEEIRLADIEIEREFQEKYHSSRTKKRRARAKARPKTETPTPAPDAATKKSDEQRYWELKKQRQYNANYYNAHRELCIARHNAYIDAHRAAWNAYQCEYRRRRKLEASAHV